MPCATIGSPRWSSCPQVLDLFWSAIEREVEKRGRRAAVRAPARHRPAPADARCGGASSGSVHAPARRPAPALLSAGAFLPPALQQAWEDIGVIVLQGYGATETGTGSCTTLEDHGLGTVGRPPDGIEMRLAAATARSSSAARPLFKGYWTRPRGDRRGVHRGRLVQDRRHRPLRRRRAGSILSGRIRTSSCCRTASTCIPRTSRTPSGSPASATPSCSRRSPAGSRRSSSAGTPPGGTPDPAAIRGARSMPP